MRVTIAVLIAAAVIATAWSPAVGQQTIPVPPFRSVELRGGGSVIVRPSPVQRVVLLEGNTGHTQVAVTANGKLVIDACRQSCPRNYRVRVLVESPNPPSLAISGGGTIRTDNGFGLQRNFSIAIRGGGTIDARSVPTVDTSAAVDGGGQILTRVDRHLTGAVNGGGAIRCWGNPQVTQAVRGGGVVSQGR